MRKKVTLDKPREFIRQLDQGCHGPGGVFLTEGASALLLGVRDQTINVDLKLDPEPVGTFDETQRLKNELGINVKLAAPDDFVPVSPD